MTKNDGGGHVDVIKRMLRSTTKTTEKESENEPQKEVYVQLSPTVPTITTSYGSPPYHSSIDPHDHHANVASRPLHPWLSDCSREHHSTRLPAHMSRPSSAESLRTQHRATSRHRFNSTTITQNHVVVAFVCCV